MELYQRGGARPTSTVTMKVNMSFEALGGFDTVLSLKSIVSKLRCPRFTGGAPREQLIPAVLF